ncbi:hypothetical protein D6D54_01165 [Spiroplasma poulsonii]|uniref:Lipoprotein n=1 Tax=Spiroplasma poulsonii TaxID=2138 RepID=A0A433ETS9_9MOLU|nr:lipoprotein [Spiroplasma poulsonii]RUP78111.1 hypothetical protein D6D54_01165 [Spiroplasma poulsonii]
MKKILSLWGATTLIGTSTTSLVACNKNYTQKELTQLKEKKKINTVNKENRDNLEWIEPQEKPFIIVDNKYYFVVWRGNENNDWRIVKFKHFEQKEKILDKYDKYELKTSHFGDLFIYL